MTYETFRACASYCNNSGFFFVVVVTRLKFQFRLLNREYDPLNSAQKFSILRAGVGESYFSHDLLLPLKKKKKSVITCGPFSSWYVNAQFHVGKIFFYLFFDWKDSRGSSAWPSIRLAILSDSSTRGQNTLTCGPFWRTATGPPWPLIILKPCIFYMVSILHMVNIVLASIHK